MTLTIPVFDVEGLRQVADMFTEPPSDPVVLAQQWRQLIADLLAAADHIELCQWERGV